MFKQDYKLSKGGKICAQTVGKFWHPAKDIKEILNQKNCPEKQEKGGKIIFMDFTARLKSCSTETKFHKFFKSYRKVA